ncbi:hypothetical protein [Kocuria arenosa]|uniref:hypothetical protein n=1 Tax=Kocuria arenosa TaxID=3071446 RepID=UPI0034D727A6
MWNNFSFTNQKEKDLPVMAPAFSLTKVMILLGPLLAGLITGLSQLIENWLNPDDTTPRPPLGNEEIITLFIALIGFFAVVVSADMLSRGIAASAQHIGASSISAAESRAKIIRFPHAINASLNTTVPERDAEHTHELVQVVAVTAGEPPRYLCLHKDENQSLSWQSKNKLDFN